MKQVELVIGNSSSGILESPYLGIPTVNVGERQKGRYRCGNIVQSGVGKTEIEQSIKKALSGKFGIKSTYWGDGNASKKILQVLKDAE
jgi:UDP-N-acetylglucosamine 2-epimerase